jgi:hypothetical protein
MGVSNILGGNVRANTGVSNVGGRDKIVGK